jgi:hypothetical protein
LLAGPATERAGERRQVEFSGCTLIGQGFFLEPTPISGFDTYLFPFQLNTSGKSGPPLFITCLSSSALLFTNDFRIIYNFSAISVQAKKSNERRKAWTALMAVVASALFRI